jgi:hypothetical protein
MTEEGTLEPRAQPPANPFAVTPPAPVGPVAVSPVPVPPVVSARQLIASSFELLLGQSGPLRGASFYIGLIVLGLIGPFVLATWGLLVANPALDVFNPVGDPAAPAAAGWMLVLLSLLVAGSLIGGIESTGVAIALLGGAQAGHPIGIRAAVQRTRMCFWPLVVASICVSIPVAIVQSIIGQSTELGFISGLVVGTLIQAPFVYAQAGIVLGGVGPIEALKRSIRIVRVRKVAALILAILPSVYGLLVLLGLGAGIDVAVRALEALGLGADSGPAGIALVTVLIVMIVFAIGTLLFTVNAIVYAPQVVMFVGLTRATIGLDRVRPGGDHDPDHHGPERARFRWLTRPMLLGFALGGLALAGFLSTVSS